MNTLTDRDLQNQAPSIFAKEPYYEVSDKYNFIPSIDVVNIFRENGFFPTIAKESNVRIDDKNGFQKHLIRFRGVNDLLDERDDAIEILLTNSHDRTSSFTLHIGIFRFICLNGLVVADNLFESIKIKHLGFRDDDVASAINRVMKTAPNVWEKVELFKSIDLSENDKKAYALNSAKLRFDLDNQVVDTSDLLNPHRVEDEKNDMWTLYNVLQENLIRGGVKGVNKNTGRNFTSKAIKSIDNDLSINKQLWELTDRLATIKSY